MSGPRAIGGQALVESLVAMLVLMPFLFGIVALSQLQTARQMAQSAAWAGAVSAHHGIDASAVMASHGSAAYRLEISLLRTAAPTAATTTEDIAFALLQPALAVGSGRLDLVRAESRRAIAVAVPSERSGLSPSGDGMAWPQRAEVSVMVDDWAARDAATVYRRTVALSTAGRIAAWRSTLQWAIEPMRLLEPAVARLCLGRIDPDIVPMDRLPALRAESADLRLRPC
jgi:Flp pilus assembly protein TadG